MKQKIYTLAGAVAVCAIALTGCGKSGSSSSTSGKEQTNIHVDGSSTVFPISQAVAEDFMKDNENIDVTVAESGTGGGMKKFVRGEIDICDASRPIEASELAECKKNGIEFVELPVAFDGITIVISKENTFAVDLTSAELKKLWEPTSKVSKWNEIRASFPATPIKLYGPGTDSGTFEYFTEAICGKKKASRSDYTASEDDNVLAQGVAGDKGALGYFGYSYYDANQDKLTAVKIDGVAPSPDTIMSGTYKPLSRPLFIYVSIKALERPEVKQLIEYYIKNAPRLVEEVKYVKLSDEAYKLVSERVEKKTTGSVFQSGSWLGMKPEDVLSKESAK